MAILPLFVGDMYFFLSGESSLLTEPAGDLLNIKLVIYGIASSFDLLSEFRVTILLFFYGDGEGLQSSFFSLNVVIDILLIFPTPDYIAVDIIELHPYTEGMFLTDPPLLSFKT
jgi:hypothetical protein